VLAALPEAVAMRVPHARARSDADTLELRTLQEVGAGFHLALQQRL
jgi:hypothetical protein